MRAKKPKTSCSKPVVPALAEPTVPVEVNNWPIFVDEGSQKPDEHEFLPLANVLPTSQETGATICCASQSPLQVVDNNGEILLALGPYETREITSKLKSTLEKSNHFLDLINSDLVRFL